jgi:Ser/Thr protein kinase RdoA (MazF antagonist)
VGSAGQVPGSGQVPSGGFLREAGLAVLSGQVCPREGRAWLVEWRGTRGILRQLPGPAAAGSARAADVAWLHEFLTRLATLGFPSPRPLPCFAGRSWVISGGTLWEIVSYLSGHPVGWGAEPTMEEIGALLARYHAAVRRVPAAGQRPGALPLANVPGVLLSGQLQAAHLEPDRAAVIRRHAEQLAHDLDGTGHHARFLRGYASVIPLTADQARVIPVYMRGRGLQMIAKRIQAGRDETGMLGEVQWLSAHAGIISDALASAVS